MSPGQSAPQERSKEELRENEKDQIPVSENVEGLTPSREDIVEQLADCSCSNALDDFSGSNHQAAIEADSVGGEVGSDHVDAEVEADSCGRRNGPRTSFFNTQEIDPSCILPASCMVPRSNAFDEFLPPVQTQVVFFIRHGQSRWNEAQAARDLLGMYQENDHGLSETGRMQATHLSSQILAKEYLLNSGAVTEEEAQWLSYFFVPQFVCTSPFTRAIETAVIGLKELLLTHGRLVVMKEAREQKNLGGADSSGVAIGEQIITRVKEELRRLYETAGQSEAFEKLVNHLEQDFEVDVSDIQESWWSTVLERDAEIAQRVQLFLVKLCRHGAGSSSVVVGHSHMFRRIFQNYIAEDLQQKKPDIVASLREHVIPCCGVIGCMLEWDLQGQISITDVMPMFGTELQPVEDLT